MVVYAPAGGGTLTEAALEAVLPPRRWCHVAVAHGQGGHLGSGTVKLFLNGQLAASAKLRCDEWRMCEALLAAPFDLALSFSCTRHPPVYF